MKTITVKTSGLTGAALDWAVAKSQGKICSIHDGNDYPHILRIDNVDYHPSSNWLQGGQIIEIESIQICPPTSPVHIRGGPQAGWGQSGTWSATVWRKGPHGRRPIHFHESSPLIAAMRTVVEAKLGDTVEVPEQLVEVNHGN